MSQSAVGRAEEISMQGRHTQHRQGGARLGGAHGDQLVRRYLGMIRQRSTSISQINDIDSRT